MLQRHLTALDNLIAGFDHALRIVAARAPAAQRPSPAAGIDQQPLSAVDRQHAAGLMRVNHSGEVCAQALYQGQAATAKLANVRTQMERAASEEIDHLAWCEQRLKALDSRPSLLNPLWYAASFALGAGAGLISDKLSLGFVAATEQQVSDHLQQHLAALPEQDLASRAVVAQMLSDEQQHARDALAAGGWQFPAPLRRAMSAVAAVMTTSSYRL